jgi:hypothetical protein
MALTANDLHPFCLDIPDDAGRHGRLERPWSSGEYTYATNGWVIVKVPRLAEVEARDGVPKDAEIERCWGMTRTQKQFRTLPAGLKLPADDEPETQDCWLCHGSGIGLHPCPHCKCQCPHCEGTGAVAVAKFNEPIKIFGTLFSPKLIKTLMGLPDLQFSAKPPKRKPARFTFTGGEGLIMPMRV